MKTPFQHFIQLAQRVLDATNEKSCKLNPCKGINALGENYISFGAFPVICRVQIFHLDFDNVRAEIGFSCPIDYDCIGYDELFTEWTKNVDEFLASDSILLLDNQIKAGLRK